MKTYSPDVVFGFSVIATMLEDPDGEWVHLEDHIATVAENALQIKRRDVEIDNLKSEVSRLKYLNDAWKSKFNGLSGG